MKAFKLSVKNVETKHADAYLGIGDYRAAIA